jgi:hypothetical protein
MPDTGERLIVGQAAVRKNGIPLAQAVLPRLLRSTRPAPKFRTRFARSLGILESENGP